MISAGTAGGAVFLKSDLRGAPQAVGDVGSLKQGAQGGNAHHPGPALRTDPVDFLLEKTLFQRSSAPETEHLFIPS